MLAKAPQKYSHKKTSWAETTVFSPVNLTTFVGSNGICNVYSNIQHGIHSCHTSQCKDLAASNNVQQLLTV